MTKQAQAVVAVKTETRGRPMSKAGKQAKNAIQRLFETGEKLTVRDIAKKLKVKKAAVNNWVQLNVKSGVLAKVDTIKADGRGRPQSVFQLNTTGVVAETKTRASTVEKQLQVLNAVTSEFKTASEVAEELGFTLATVKNIFRALTVSGQVTTLAVKSGGRGRPQVAIKKVAA